MCLEVTSYYDPQVGRFVNADDVNVLTTLSNQILGINLFAYCNNNPIMNKDKSGYFAFIWSVVIGAIFGVFVLYIIDLIINLITGIKKWWLPTSSLAEYLAAAAGGAIGATGIGKWAAVIASAVINGATYIANCISRRKPIKLLDFGMSLLIGIITGFIGGAGTNLSKKMGVINATRLKKITAVSSKRIAQYVKKIKNNIMGIVIDAIRNFLATAVGRLPGPAKQLARSWSK